MAKSIKETKTEKNLARSEGFDDAARSFEQIAKVEKFHEARPGSALPANILRLFLKFSAKTTNLVGPRVTGKAARA